MSCTDVARTERTRWARLGVVVGVAALALTALAAHPADAVTFDRYGWWSRLNQNGVDLGIVPPATPPPAGTMAVGLDAQGATAVSAVHFDLGADEADPVLTLRVDPSSTNATADGIVLLACRTKDGWKGGANQDWAARPPSMCDAGAGGGSVTGARSGTSWTFRVGPLVTGRAVDVVLVPAAAGGGATSYQVNFAAPTASSLAVSAAPAPTTEAPTTTPAPSVTSAPAAPVSPAPDPGPAPVFEAPTAPTPTAAPDIDPGTGQTRPTVEVALPVRAVPSAVTRVARRPWVRVLAGIQVLGAAALAWYLYRQPAGDPKDDDVRGLGPFVARRSGEVTRL